MPTLMCMAPDAPLIHVDRSQSFAARPQHVQRLLNDKLEAGLAPRTVAGIRAVLRASLNDAVAWNLLDRNPAQHVRAPRPESPRGHPVTGAGEEAPRHCQGALAAPIDLCGSGCRVAPGRSPGLGWSDVDLENKTLRVVRALQRVGTDTQSSDNGAGRDALVRTTRKTTKTRLQFVEPKSRTSRRTVKLPEFAVKALKEHRTAQKIERMAAGGDWLETGLVFTTPTGEPSMTARCGRSSMSAGEGRAPANALT